MKQLPLFVASTFRDMDDERDDLVHLVLPQVNQQLRAAGHDAAVYPVDLRWGITSRQHEDPALRERFILDTCVAEVRRCQPLFLGLLGDKYGYVADRTVRGPVIAEAGLVEDPALPLSVTAIELLTAARATGQHGIPPVLLRRRLDAENATAASAGKGVEYVNHPELVDGLCQRLLDEGQSVVDYRSTWQADSERLISPDFVQLAVQAIFAQVTRGLPAVREIDWLERELAAQREYARGLREVMVGRDGALHAINEFLMSSSPSTLDMLAPEPRQIDLSDLTPAEKDRVFNISPSLTLTGAPGVGLSTLIARATDAPARWFFDPRRFLAEMEGIADPAPRLCAVVHIGATLHSATPEVALLLLLAQLDWPAANKLAAVGHERLSLDVVLEHWLEALRRLPPMEKAVIALDGLDFLRAQVDGIPKAWAWIPLDIGQSAVFLLSARTDSLYAQLLNARPGNAFLEVMDVTEREGTQLVADFADRRHRPMPASVRTSLVDRSRNPRWLTLATDVLLTLTGKEYQLLRHPALKDYDDELALEMLVHVEAERLPLEPASLQYAVLRRLQLLIGDIATVMPRLIALCGVLRETDLESICKRAAMNADLGEIATVRALLRESIGSDGTYLWLTDLDLAEKITEFRGRGGWLPRHENILVDHLLDLPANDEIRSASLGMVLLILGRFDHFAAALVAPDSSAERVAQSAAPILRELIEDQPQLPKDLLEACASDAQRLAVGELLLSVSGQLSPERESAIHLDVQRHLGIVSPVARTRSGNTAASLLQASELTVADQTAQLQKWAIMAAQRTEDVLHDLPIYVGSGDDARFSGRQLDPGAGGLISALDVVTGQLTSMAMYDDISLNKRDMTRIDSLLSSVKEVRQNAPERLQSVLDGYSSALVDLSACLLGRHHDVDGSLVAQARKLSKGNDLIELICAVRLFDVAALRVRRRTHEQPKTATDLLTLCEARELLWEGYWVAQATSTVVPRSKLLAALAAASAVKIMMVSGGVWNGDVARAGVTGLGTEIAVTELGDEWLPLAMLALANGLVFGPIDPGPLAALVPGAMARYPASLDDSDWPAGDPELLALVACLDAFRRSRLSDSSLVLTLLAGLTDSAHSRRVPLRDIYEAVNEELLELENDMLQWDPEEGFQGESEESAFEWGGKLANILVGLEFEDVRESENTRQAAEIAARARYHLFVRGADSPENVLGVGLNEAVTVLMGAGESLFADDPGFDRLRNALEGMFGDAELPSRERHAIQVIAGALNEVASWSS